MSHEAGATAYKALHTGQPCYLADLIDSYEPSRCLRSTNCHLLAVPSCVKPSFASRAFCVSSPNNWNSLPAHIRSSDSLVTFQSRLKSHLFSSADHMSKVIAYEQTVSCKHSSVIWTVGHTSPIYWAVTFPTEAHVCEHFASTQMQPLSMPVLTIGCPQNTEGCYLRIKHTHKWNLWKQNCTELMHLFIAYHSRKQ